MHFNNLINHLSPLARKLSSRCRQSSMLRNSLREFHLSATRAHEKIEVIKQGSLGTAGRKALVREVEELLAGMRRTAARESLADELKRSLSATITKIDKALARVSRHSEPAKALAHIPANKRQAYEQVFGLIYDCSPNQAAAHMLVERILSKLSHSGGPSGKRA